MSDKAASYVGPEDLHGATISRVERDGSAIRVLLTSADGRAIALQFTGVTEIDTRGTPNGKTIHALVEADAAHGLRRFLFLPWEDDRAPEMELVAEGLYELESDRSE